jgi:hypothetical protein
LRSRISQHFVANSFQIHRGVRWGEVGLRLRRIFGAHLAERSRPKTRDRRLGYTNGPAQQRPSESRIRCVVHRRQASSRLIANEISPTTLAMNRHHAYAATGACSGATSSSHSAGLSSPVGGFLLHRFFSAIFTELRVQLVRAEVGNADDEVLHPRNIEGCVPVTEECFSPAAAANRSATLLQTLHASLKKPVRGGREVPLQRTIRH